MKLINEQNERGVLMEDANLGHGRYGKTVLFAGESTAADVEYSYMLIVSDALFLTIYDASLDSNKDTKFVGVELPSGLIFPGEFKNISLTSGFVILYKEKGE